MKHIWLAEGSERESKEYVIIILMDILVSFFESGVGEK